ncbi:MAG: radical SAM protein [Promethearchaeota archaeon]
MDSSKYITFKHSGYLIFFNGHKMTLSAFPQKEDSFKKNKFHGHFQDEKGKSKSIHHFLTRLKNTLPTHSIQRKKKNHFQDHRPTLLRLTLNVSNICNMACKYCYADRGTYYTSGQMMTKETAFNAINFASRNFSNIEHVNFFGGEPTMNEPIIRLVCEYFIYLHNQGILSHLPSFGLTTNGYDISELMFEVIKKYQFSVSVSLDGPKFIHDQLRVSKKGFVTFEAIAKNVDRLIGMGVNPEFECTYTKLHWQNGIDLKKLMDFFYERFQCRILHCPLVITTPNSPWFIPLDVASKLYTDAINYSIENLSKHVPKSLSVATRFLNSLVTKIPISQYCPAAKSTLTINADGNVFSCFLLMHGTGYCLDNVNSDYQGLGPPDTIHTLLKMANKWQNPACQKCWAQALCFGCLGEDLVREGERIYRSSIPGKSNTCDFKRSQVQAFLTSIVDKWLEVGQNPDFPLDVKHNIYSNKEKNPC